jgi:hypothetical protein
MRLPVIAILSFAAVVGFPQLAGAKLTIPTPALGYIESTLDYCAKVDAGSAAKYKEREKALVAGATKEELEKARGTTEYKESFDSTTDHLSKTPTKEVAKSCAAFLEGK